MFEDYEDEFEDCVKEGVDVYTNERFLTQPMVFKFLCSKNIDDEYICNCLQRISLENEKELEYIKNGNANKTNKKINDLNESVRSKIIDDFIKNNGFLPFPKNVFQSGTNIDLTEDLYSKIDKSKGSNIFVSYGETQMFIKLKKEDITNYNLIHKQIPYVLQSCDLIDGSKLLIILVNPFLEMDKEKNIVIFDSCESTTGILIKKRGVQK